MKKKYFALIVLLVSAVIPLQLQAQDVNFFRQEGIASWYGREFDGRTTASGEIFNSDMLTAAHPYLPFGTMIVVTNQHNNKSVTVRVNDRGPFIPARIIDVSRAAAEQLDMIVTGTAHVTVVSIDRIVLNYSDALSNIEFISTTTTTQESTPVVTSTTTQESTPVVTTTTQDLTPVVTSTIINSQSVNTTSQVNVTQPVIADVHVNQLRLIPEINIVPARYYRFQVGSFRIARYAIEASDKLVRSGLNPSYERFVDNNNVEYFRVLVTGIPGTEVQSTIERISAAGFLEAFIREEN